MKNNRDQLFDKLESTRKDLLDLGLRNSLLNHRTLRSRGIEVTGVEPAAVFELLVEEDMALSFAPQDEDRVLDYGDGLVDRAVLADSRELPTVHDEERLQRRLLSTFYSARSSIEEQGVNVLYLALGMLEWFDEPDREVPRRAPLVLVPVQLSRASVRARFRMAWTGEDIGTNLSLQTMLKMQFGAELPDIEEDECDGFDLPAYFEAVEQAVGGLPRWRVDRVAVGLGFFTFGKLMMYRDLAPENWNGDEVPAGARLITELLGEGLQAGVEVSEDLDECRAHRELHQVCDADSSQTLVLQAVAAGQDQVIQGPPGTGKSQTIVNLIANGLARGQRVLFVAEKMAALDVVKRRLDQLGLGQACLELHSHKASKKHFLADLQATLEREVSYAPERNDDLAWLAEARRSLDEPNQALHEAIGTTGTTAFQAMGGFLAASRRLGDVHVPPRPEMDFTAWNERLHAEHRALLQEVQEQVAVMGLPATHMFWGSARTEFLPADEKRLREICARARQALSDLQQGVDGLATNLDTVLPEDLEAVDKLQRLAGLLAQRPDLDGLAVREESWRWRRAGLKHHIASARRLRTLEKRFHERLLPGGWQADVVESRRVLARARGHWWRYVLPGWWKARRQMQTLLREPDAATEEYMIEMAEAILEVQGLHAQLADARVSIQAQLGERWQGSGSDLDALELVVDYLGELHGAILEGNLPLDTLDRIDQGDWKDRLEQDRQTVLDSRDQFRTALNEAIELLELDLSRRVDDAVFKDECLVEMDRLLAEWHSDSARVKDMVAWNHLCQRLADADLDALGELAGVWAHADGHLVDLLDYWRFDRLIHKALKQHPSLAAFDGRRQERLAERFSERDERLLLANRSVVAARHGKALPEGSGPGQIGVLRHEFGKKRRHRSIRRLMNEAGQAVQAIKPVFMMSPLSVATHLPPGSVDFDLVIFDEASQIRPVDAMGALLRARQAVVVGDSRQLPPTRFWSKLGLDDEKDDQAEELPAGELESILALFVARGAPSRMLRWHYRSRHDSLIAVSNREFYDDRLIVPPSPDHGRSELGLVLRHLPEAVYQPGEAVNPTEAQAVADAVMAHARQHPEMTLGVVAFGWPQARAVQDAVEQLRMADDSLEAYFGNHEAEPFFVKNLENVQGDERDVILISVGYGRNAEGKVSMNFGPLNQVGGERRLNVMITRARRRCEVFTNLQAEDIDLTRTRARGVEAFKTFLTFAGQRELAEGQTAETETSERDDLESDIVQVLEKAGLTVRALQGSARNFLDLAVVDPDRPGRFLLGIDLDGPDHGQATWARDRDRIRRQVMQNLEWRIQPVWSLDWFRDRDRECRKLLDAVESARQLTDAGKPAAEERQPEPSTQVAEQATNRADVDRPSAEQVLPYRTAVVDIGSDRQTLQEMEPGSLQEWLVCVVREESPVHKAEAFVRVARGLGCKRLTRVATQALEHALQQVVEQGKVEQREAFLWQPGQQSVSVRDRSDHVGRDIGRVAPEEIRQAGMMVVERAVGISPDDLVHEVALLLGFVRLGERGQRIVQQALEPLKLSGEVRERNGFWVVGEKRQQANNEETVQ